MAGRQVTSVRILAVAMGTAESLQTNTREMQGHTQRKDGMAMIDGDDPRLSWYEREIASMRGDFRHESDANALACCAMGLAEEAGEVTNAARGDGARRETVIAELGDVVWYAVTAANRLDCTEMDAFAGGDHWSTYGRDGLLWMLHGEAAKFSGAMKKALFHGRGIDAQRAELLLRIGNVLRIVYALAPAYGSTLFDVQRANVAKLRARYPSGGFSAAEANAHADEPRECVTCGYAPCMCDQQ